MDYPYTVMFEHVEQFTTVTVGKVYAADGTEAITKALTHLRHPQEWKCVGLDRDK